MIIRSIARHGFGGLLAALVYILLVSATAAQSQSIQPRGVIQPGTVLTPPAQQQLNQNLSRQQNNFSAQQRIDSNNRLNRTEQINRNNTRTDGFSTCPAANLACKN